MYKAIQWATGPMGAAILRGMLDHPAIEVVGAYVYSPQKVGKDVGELVRRPPVGVRATDRVEDIVAMDADVVIHAGRLGAYGSHDDEIARLLASGKNVISINGYTHTAYWSNERSSRLQAACEKGGVSLCGAGLNPGFIAEQVATLVTGLSCSVDHIEVVEWANAAKIPDSGYLFGALGFGGDPRRDLSDVSWGPIGALNGMYEEALGAVAARMGMRIDLVKTDHMVYAAQQDIVLRAGRVPAGTICHTNWRWHGIVGGRRRLTLSIHWYVETAHLDNPDPPLWQVHVTGHPGVKLSIDLEKHPQDRTRMSAEQYAVAARVIHMLPHVVAAPPGLMLVPAATPARDDYAALASLGKNSGRLRQTP